ncbi:sugar phosphorylase [Desulfobacterales bacterium HSG16]|nr:sugar phosphorylase [Desulfobacterales bacterium HSG16]
MNRIYPILEKIYGKKKGKKAFSRISPLIENFDSKKRKKRKNSNLFSQEDVILITYGDSLSWTCESGLTTLHKFARRYLAKKFNAIHILPFYPYSSDDGFSVIDFFKVNPDIGSWNDIQDMSQDFKLMFDFVANHVSAKSQWFENFINQAPGFENFAITTDPEADLSQVTRPRTLPLLTPFKLSDGRQVHVWTTFSADQIDLNYKSLDVLEKMVEVLLFYLKKNARILRLDAIAYLWKEKGTVCIHLEQAHDVVRLFRTICDCVSPDTLILTETNVPHDENISYFGNGQDEAQMVYNFTLPPLLIYTLLKADAAALSEWAKTLVSSPYNTFFNFTASHDGIGVRPLEGMLPHEEIDLMVDKIKKNKGQVSYKKNPDGSKSPYELNITYIDALYDGNDENEDPFHISRVLASCAIQLALCGVPGIYINTLTGSRNWYEGVKKTKRARTINREKHDVDRLMAELENPDSFRSKIFFPLLNMIKTRIKQPAFHPNADFEILDYDPRIFAIKRFCDKQILLALTNVSSESVQPDLCKKQNLSGLEVKSEVKAESEITDLLTGSRSKIKALTLKPYQSIWFTI